MRYKGWLILTIILGFFWTPLWILSVVIAILGIYSDKKIVVKPVVRRSQKKKKATKKKPKKKKR